MFTFIVLNSGSFYIFAVKFTKLYTSPFLWIIWIIDLSLFILKYLFNIYQHIFTSSYLTISFNGIRISTGLQWNWLFDNLRISDERSSLQHSWSTYLSVLLYLVLDFARRTSVPNSKYHFIIWFLCIYNFCAVPNSISFCGEQKKCLLN